MKKFENKNFIFLSAISVLLLVFCAIATTLAVTKEKPTQATFSYAEESRIKLILYRATSDELVKDVTVVVAETGKRVSLSKEGYLSFPKELSFVTLLFYKENYLDTAVYRVPLTAGKLQTYRYALYPKDESDLPFIVYTESPNPQDTQNLLDTYRK